MSGCAICVYDLYQESMDQYRESIENIRYALTSQGVPESEWPQILLSGQTNSDLIKASHASESAFEALERALAAKSLSAR